jgi:tRNA(Arg) A34 adenosine deaminase TadA
MSTITPVLDDPTRDGGVAVVGLDGTVLGRGHNRRVQDGDPSAHEDIGED